MIGVLASGEGTNLQALIDAGLPIAGVISSKEGARALERAEAAGIETAVFDLNDFPTREDRDEAMADWLQARGVDLVVLAGFMWLLRDNFLARFPDRIVNTHAAYLPEFPGASPVARPVVANTLSPMSKRTPRWVGLAADPPNPPARRRLPTIARTSRHPERVFA